MGGGRMELMNLIPSSAGWMQAGLVISSALLQEMACHAARCFPLEACGILGGRDNRAEVVIPIPNTSPDPFRFRMDPQNQVDSFFSLEKIGLKLLAIYHSHPHGPDCLSATDLAEAHYLTSAHILWYTQDEKWKYRAFRVNGDKTEEISIYIEHEWQRLSAMRVK